MVYEWNEVRARRARLIKNGLDACFDRVSDQCAGRIAADRIPALGIPSFSDSCRRFQSFVHEATNRWLRTLAAE